MKGFPMQGTSALNHGTTDDFLYGRNGHHPDKMEGKHEDSHTDKIEAEKEKPSPNKQTKNKGFDNWIKNSVGSTQFLKTRAKLIKNTKEKFFKKSGKLKDWEVIMKQGYTPTKTANIDGTLND